MKPRRVGVLTGGDSIEEGGSSRSGRAIAEALLAAGHPVLPIRLGSGADSLKALSVAGIDVAFLALQGRLGEDGCIQGLLEWLEIPYTGASLLASALAMDKLKAKELFRLHNVPTPPYYLVKGRPRHLELEETHGAFGFPVVVKPRRAGSGVGLGRAGSLAELAQAVDLALNYDDSVLVERHIRGCEVHVGILQGRVLGAIEVARSQLTLDPTHVGAGIPQYFMPARLGVQRYSGVLNLAERAADALGADGAVGVHLVVSEGQNEYVLEVDTQPGMDPTSRFPQIAAASGYGFTDLCETILARARLHALKKTGDSADAIDLLEADAETAHPEPALARISPRRQGSGRVAQRSRMR